MEQAVYQNNERVIIVKEHGLDYLIEDTETGKQYLVDKTYFHKRYASEEERLPVHTELWERMQALSAENYQLKRTLKHRDKDLKSEKKRTEALRKKLKPEQHYRNGQKRGRTRNG
jgi:hypothetical protein